MATSTPSARRRFQHPLVAWALAAAALTSRIVVADEPAAKGDLPQPVRITGRVVNDHGGRPVPEAEVFVRLRDPSGAGSDSVKRTKANAQGEFTFETSYPGRYRVWAHRGKFTSRLKPPGGEPVLVAADMKPLEPIVLRMIPAVTVRVTVTDQGSGRPIPGASVRQRRSDDLPVFQTDVSENDHRATDPEETYHNWAMANERTAAALHAKNHDYRYVFSRATTHCDSKVFEQTLADTLVWMWRGYHAE